MAEVVKRRWWSALLPLIALAALAVVVIPGSASASSGFTISGTVTSATGQSTPIAGATVTVEAGDDYYDGDGYSDGVVVTTTTSSTGTYSVSVPSAESDQYEILVGDAAGYVDGSTETYFNEGASSETANVSLDPASFWGTITDSPSGDALSDQAVDLLDGGDQIDSTTTDSDGYYAFPTDDFNSGDTYTIEAPGDKGYNSAYYDASSATGTPSASSATPLTAEAGSLNIALTPASNDGEIAGTISDAGGAVSGATVEVTNTANNEDYTNESVQTSSTGTYVITDLPAGTYDVEALPLESSSDVPTYYGNTGDPYTSTAVTVTDGSTSSGANIQFISGGSVSGTITASSGTGIPDVDVDIDNAGGEQVTTAVTGNDGTYSASGLAPGTYYVYLDASESDDINSSDYASQWYGATGGTSSALQESNATAVSVTAGANSVVNQSLVLGGEISGSVKDAASGSGLAGNVDVYDSAGDLVGEGSSSDGSSANGTYTVAGLPAGNYYVYYQGSFSTYSSSTGTTPVNDASAWYGGSSPAESLQTATAVAVTTGATPATANVSLPAAGSIQGTVTAGGKPESGVEVSLYDSEGNPLINEGYVDTLSDGVYEIQGLLPGTYKVEFSTGGNANLAFQYYNNASTLSAANTVTVTAGTTTKSINGALSTGGTITGTVTDASSKADLPDVEVDLLDAQGHVLADTTTDQNGTYSLAGVPTGSYYVEFVAEGAYATVYQDQYYGGTQVLAGSTQVTVTASQTTSNINAALLPDSTAAVVSTTISGTPTVAGTVPEIVGTDKVGAKLKVVVSGWTPGTSYTYQWFAGSLAVKGATASTFTSTGADYRRAIHVVVTGALSGYNSTVETSTATKALAAGTLKTGVPKIAGTAKVGSKLVVKVGEWTKGTKFTYQWYAKGKAIKGARKSTLKLTSAEKGKSITVKVTGRLTGYRSVTKTSKAKKVS